MRHSQLARTRANMDLAVPDALVEGYEPLIEALTLPDPDDRHVLAGDPLQREFDRNVQ